MASHRSSLRRNRNGFLSMCGLLLSGALVAPGCSPGVIDEPETAVEADAKGPSLVAGQATIISELNDVVLDLPAGWFAVVPTGRIGVGVLTIANYDVSQVENTRPDHSSHSLTDDTVKVDISTVVPEDGSPVGQWVQRRLAEINGDSMGQATLENLTQYNLAGRSGLAYRIQQGQYSALEVALPWEDGKILLATILPVETRKLEAALPILDQLRSMAEDRASQGEPRPARDIAELAAPLKELQPVQSMEMNNVSAMGSCTSWTGSDSGSIAPNTPIKLNLPFYVGTWWKAGAAGSFWGNLAHGNCNDDYYAIDFNRSDSGCGTYYDDCGYKLYPSASGTAYVYNSGDTSYGLRVDVDHGNGLKTRYAHMSQVLVSSGQSVGTQTVIGYVGTTGNSSGCHLHYGFYKSGYSRCNSSTGRCPNGEYSDPYQSPKPSPMYTNNGSVGLADGRCLQAPP